MVPTILRRATRAQRQFEAVVPWEILVITLDAPRVVGEFAMQDSGSCTRTAEPSCVFYSGMSKREAEPTFKHRF